jgi:hypothetical protein
MEKPVTTAIIVTTSTVPVEYFYWYNKATLKSIIYRVKNSIGSYNERSLQEMLYLSVIHECNWNLSFKEM